MRLQGAVKCFKGSAETFSSLPQSKRYEQVGPPVDADQMILEEIRRGNPRRFAVLIDRHKDRAMTLAVRLLGRREEAEELVQDSFLRAFRNLESFRGEARFSTWFYRILYNTCMTAVLRRKQRELSWEEEGEEPPAPEEGSDPLRLLEEGETQAILREELARLPEQYRSAVTLFYVQEMSYEETRASADRKGGGMNNHIADDDLQAYLDGRLEESRVRSLEGHLEKCPPCSLELARARELDQALRRVPLEVTSPAFTASILHTVGLAPGGRGTSRSWEHLGYAVALMLVLGAMMATFFWTGVIGSTPGTESPSRLGVLLQEGGGILAGAASSLGSWVVSIFPFLFGKGTLGISLSAVAILLLLAILDRVAGRYLIERGR
jgi:RNA polymerase sigma factor (sigma-70 family)